MGRWMAALLLTPQLVQLHPKAIISSLQLRLCTVAPEAPFAVSVGPVLVETTYHRGLEPGMEGDRPEFKF